MSESQITVQDTDDSRTLNLFLKKPFSDSDNLTRKTNFFQFWNTDDLDQCEISDMAWPQPHDESFQRTVLTSKSDLSHECLVS